VFTFSGTQAKYERFDAQFQMFRDLQRVTLRAFRRRARECACARVSLAVRVGDTRRECTCDILRRAVSDALRASHV